MPRQPDPDLEERILQAADALWRRGGAKALTMRAVARAAGTNTPAMYRRFKNRQVLLRGLLMRIADRLRRYFEREQTLEKMAEAYVEFALRQPHDYELFYSHAAWLSPRKKTEVVQPIRATRPNFALVERVAADELGGQPEDYTQLALQLWATTHGTATLLLSRSIPRGHEEALRTASRATVKLLIEQAKVQKE